jgi:hypothetical protein
MILKADIKNMYESWCKENSSKPMKMSILYTNFDDLYGKSCRCTTKEYKGKWVYKGLKVKEEEEDCIED